MPYLFSFFLIILRIMGHWCIFHHPILSKNLLFIYALLAIIGVQFSSFVPHKQSHESSFFMLIFMNFIYNGLESCSVISTVLGQDAVLFLICESRCFGAFLT